jgi:predicted transcriptional regulator
VGTTATLLHAARIMCDQHIHRLIAVDRIGRPEGIVSSLDVVAALVQAVDE